MTGQSHCLQSSLTPEKDPEILKEPPSGAGVLHTEGKPFSGLRLGGGDFHPFPFSCVPPSSHTGVPGQQQNIIWKQESGNPVAPKPDLFLVLCREQAMW